MNTETIRIKYIQDFDQYLIQNNNELVNSNVYLDYKEIYLGNTEINYNNLSELNILLYDYQNNYQVDISNKKYSYTYVDTTMQIKLNLQVKELILNQNKIYANFINHVKFLTV